MSTRYTPGPDAHEIYVETMEATMKTEKRECPHCHGSLERYEDPLAVKMLGDEIELAESLIQERDALALRLAELAASLDRCANAWNTNQDVPYWVWQSMRQLADKALAKPKASAEPANADSSDGAHEDSR